MKVKSYIIALLLLSAISFFAFMLFRSGDGENNLNYLSTFTGRDLTKLQEEYDASELEDSLQLALVGIDIMQGEEGVKSWDLKAKWGTFLQKSGHLLTDEPFITYYNTTEKRDESAPIYISASKGTVLENNSYITLEDNVKIAQEDLEISGDFLEFFSEEEYAKFPNGSLLTSDTMLGKADSLIWELEKEFLKAEGEVVLIINNDNKSYSLEFDYKVPPTFDNINTQSE